MPGLADHVLGTSVPATIKFRASIASKVPATAEQQRAGRFIPGELMS